MMYGYLIFENFFTTIIDGEREKKKLKKLN